MRVLQRWRTSCVALVVHPFDVCSFICRNESFAVVVNVVHVSWLVIGIGCMCWDAARPQRAVLLLIRCNSRRRSIVTFGRDHRSRIRILQILDLWSRLCVFVVCVKWRRLAFCSTSVCVIWNCYCHLLSGFSHLVESPGFFLKFPGHGKSQNLPVVQRNQQAFYV